MPGLFYNRQVSPNAKEKLGSILRKLDERSDGRARRAKTTAKPLDCADCLRSPLCCRLGVLLGRSMNRYQSRSCLICLSSSETGSSL